MVSKETVVTVQLWYYPLKKKKRKYWKNSTSRTFLFTVACGCTPLLSCVVCWCCYEMGKNIIREFFIKTQGVIIHYHLQSVCFELLVQDPTVIWSSACCFFLISSCSSFCFSSADLICFWSTPPSIDTFTSGLLQLKKNVQKQICLQIDRRD